MSSTYSPSLRIELIGAGDQAGTWGSTTNTNLGTLIESAIAGYVSVSVTSANQAFTALDGAADQARNAVIALSTTTGANFNVYAPPQEKTYIIYNTTAFTATIFNSTAIGNTTAAGAGITVPAGGKVLVFSDGTDFYSTSAPNLTGAVTSVGAVTSLGSFTSSQLLTALTDETGTGAAVFATSPTLVTPALGTPTALVGTNITGTAAGLSIGGNAATATTVTTNANLTGAVTSVGNAASLGSFTTAQLLAAVTGETGTGAVVFGTSPTLTTPTINSAQIATVSGTAPLYLSRAWVNFDGTGTVAIRASGNVSSITDNGTGDYTINFTTVMPDANYAFTVGSSKSSGDLNTPNSVTVLSSSLRVEIIAYTTSPRDQDYVCVSIFR
jgi:hypothetical protein